MKAVLVAWGVLACAAALGGPALATAWPAWPWAFGASAVWGANLLVLIYLIGPPFASSRAPVLAAGFALLMTLFGSGSYWATIQLYPSYRVSIERAAWFVAVCTFVALTATVIVARALARRPPARRGVFEWQWDRLAALSYLMIAAAALGTVIAIRRIGYVPLLSGDPTSARVDFPAIGGIWYRLSLLGGVVTLLVAAQVVARRATPGLYLAGLAGLGMMGLYGPRFFVALPLAVSFLLWDRLRAPLPLGRMATVAVVGAPLLALAGYFREKDQSVSLLAPVALLLYGTVGEFRDLGWALDYYSLGDRFVHGQTLGSLVVPILPSAVWQIVGIDKAAIYAQNSATILADAMGQTAGQRIGAYGEFFMNFGWTGALVGAALYGALIGYLDDRFRRASANQVGGVFLALAIATTVFAQVGQLNMFTSTLTGIGYPLGLVALFAARRRVPAA